jgi:hypothetical protein
MWQSHILRPSLSESVGPDGKAFQIGLEGSDVLGRLNWVAAASLGDAAGPRGGSLVFAYRGLPVEIRAHFFSALEKPGRQRVVRVPEFDQERRGGFLGLAWGRAFTGGRLRVEAGAGSTRAGCAERGGCGAGRACLGEVFSASGGSCAAAEAGSLVAPMPGNVVRVTAAVGTAVVAGDALVVIEDPLLNSNAGAFASLAAKQRLPAVGFRNFAESGGLLAYGANRLELYRRAAYFVDRILKGAKPGDLPIERASKFELIVNSKTAKNLGVKIPQSILIRADQVIQ